jgi:hypothetical protein
MERREYWDKTRQIWWATCFSVLTTRPPSIIFPQYLVLGSSLSASSSAPFGCICGMQVRVLVDQFSPRPQSLLFPGAIIQSLCSCFPCVSAISIARMMLMRRLQLLLILLILLSCACPPAWAFELAPAIFSHLQSLHRQVCFWALIWHRKVVGRIGERTFEGRYRVFEGQDATPQRR